MLDTYARDLEWLAVDAVGCVAILANAGEGPVPSQVIECESAYNALLEFVAGLEVLGGYMLKTHEIFTRSSSGSVQFSGIGGDVTPDDDVARVVLRDFIEFAKRGLFSYDWSDVHRPASLESKAYELVAAPIIPLDVLVFPPELRPFIQRFPDRKFNDSPKLTLEGIPFV